MMAEDTAGSKPAAADEGDQKPTHVATNMSALPLSDDILSHALQYSDFQSTCRFAQTTKKNSHISTNEHTNEQGYKPNGKPFDQMWRDVYNRHMFAGPPATGVVSEIRRRRQLFDNLTGESRLRGSQHNNTKPSSKKSVKQCLSLPNRYVHFLPILPQLDVDNEEDREMMEAMEEDPPPCDFGCESFALLPGTSSRFILMDPYDGAIAVYNDVLDGAVQSDDAMMEAAFRAGADAITMPAIERKVEANQSVSRRPPPAETLHSIEEYFATDLSEYFVLPSGNNGNNAAIVMTENDEVTVDWLGLDLHPIVTASGGLVGSLIGAARVLTCESSAESALNVENGSVTRSCMEVLGWKSTSVDGRFDQAFVCRLKGFPNYVDIDASHDKVYATYSPGDGPSIPGRLTTRRTADASGHNDIGNGDADDDLDIEFDWNGHPVRASAVIVRYPLVRKVDNAIATTDKDEIRRRYFPEPETFIETDRPVSCFVIDPTGEALVAGTDGGCVELWTTSRKRTVQTGDDLKMEQTQVLNVEQSIIAAKERERKRLANLKLKRLRSVSDAVPPEEDEHRVFFGEKDEAMLLDDNCEDDNIDGDEDVEMGEVEAVSDGSNNAGEAPNESGETGGQDSSLTQCKSTRQIKDIFHPRHLGLHRAGFVTLQHHRTEGATLALWQKPSLDQSVADPEEKFELSAVINLPLSPQRKPQVHYDGRRLIVVGQDHIGVIVLIYHVLSTWEDKDIFDNDPHEAYEHNENESGMPREESGGVINLSPSTRRVRYVNRVRNVGLGNLEAYDPIYCTCNERYVVVNTKCGNLIGGDGGTNACEGLFVIDLEDKE